MVFVRFLRKTNACWNETTNFSTDPKLNIIRVTKKKLYQNEIKSLSHYYLNFSDKTSYYMIEKIKHIMDYIVQSIRILPK